MRVEHKAIPDGQGGIIDTTQCFYTHEGVDMQANIDGIHTEDQAKMIIQGRRQRAAQTKQEVQ